MFEYSKHPEKPDILTFCTEVSIKLLFFQVGCHPLSNNAEEKFPFNIQKIYLLELNNIQGIIHLGD